MIISKSLDANNILTNCTCKSRWQLIDKLIDLLAKNNTIKVKDKEQIKESLIIREKKMTTGIGNSIAIPHCTTDRVEKIILAMAVLKKGVAFNSIDNIPAQIIIMIITPESRKNIHIQALTAIAKIMDQTEVKDKILEQTDPRQILKIIKQNEGKK